MEPLYRARWTPLRHRCHQTPLRSEAPDKAVRRYLERVEGLSPTRQPGPTLAEDAANGVELYRRNVGARLAHPQERRTDVAVLLVVATRDRYITTALLDDIGRHCSDLRRIEVDARHWLPASQPDVVAALVREHVARHSSP